MRASTVFVVVLVGISVPAAALVAPAPLPVVAPMWPLDDHPDPGASPSFALFPGHDAVVTALESFRGHPWVTLHALGASEQGRPILAAEVADPGSSVPRSERVVTFVFTQQHGNEPAGTPAALAILDEIVSGGEAASWLADQVLVLLPMANPDGATAVTRENADGADINRDHIGLETVEARVLHEVLARWDVHVAMDHHEYGGTGLGNPFPLRIYDYDLTTLYPVHGNVRTPTSDASQALMYDGIWPAAQADGFTTNEYGEQTLAGIPVQQLAGGPDPGIMRNHLGLHHVAGLLVETRVDAHPNPFHDADRRTAIHASVMHATLRYVDEHAQMFIDAKRASEAASVAEPHTHYMEGDIQGPLAAAYRLPADARVDGLFALHGLPAGVPVEEGVVHNMVHDLQGHAAAAIHPLSTRVVADGAVPAEPVAAPIEATAADGSDEAGAVPFVGAVLAVLFMALVALRRRR